MLHGYRPLPSLHVHPGTSSLAHGRSPTTKQKAHSHASSTPRNLPPFLHTLYLSLPMRIRLAFHIVIIKRLTPIAYEE